MMISTVTGTQVYKAISPIIGKNITDLNIFRLRNKADLDGVIEEVSAIHDTKTLLHIYKVATEEPYSFLYIKLNATTNVLY